MLYIFLTVFLAMSPVAVIQAQTLQEESMHRQIHAEQLKSWYDQNKIMIVLDARSAEYFDGTLLPNARWLPAEVSEEEITAELPSKNSLIVVYCAGTTCPASGWLYDKLTAMGYDNVYEYHEGLKDWKERGYPTTNCSSGKH